MPLFNTTLDIKLILLVKDNPVLYNPAHWKHSDYETRVAAWQRIADVLCRPAAKCKSRWLNIRDMMRKTLNKRLRHPDQRFHNYRYENELAFMIPFFKLNSLDTSECAADYLEENTEIEMQEDPFQIQQSVFIKTENKDVPQELNPKDPLDMFLMAIGSTMRKFNPYYLNQAKSKIFQICQEYELQQLNDAERET